MTALKNAAAAKFGDHTISLNDVLYSMKVHRELGHLLSASRRNVIRLLASERKLVPSATELQEVADGFRRVHGLTSAAATQDWLASDGLSTDDFERMVEDSALEAALAESVLGKQMTDLVKANVGTVIGAKSSDEVGRQLVKVMFDAWLNKQMTDRGYEFLLLEAATGS